MQNESGLINLWTQGDWVTRAVAILLLAMSLASWMVIAVKLLQLRAAARQAKAVEGFWHAANFEAGVAALGTAEDNPFTALALEGKNAIAHHAAAKSELQSGLDTNDWLTRCLRNCIDESTARLQSGLAVLASVGSTSPFVGLFGTVWGIYHALLAISSAGQATIDKVAGPIGEALIMTALGLAVAIPAVLGYNALVRGNKGVSAKLNRFAHDLHAYFMTGGRIGSHATLPSPAKGE
jgi:biopolymer transport protein ExbB